MKLGLLDIRAYYEGEARVGVRALLLLVILDTQDYYEGEARVGGHSYTGLSTLRYVLFIRNSFFYDFSIS